MALFQVDASSSTYLAVCQCGWRSLQLTRADAWQAAGKHERLDHPGSQQARQNVRQLKARHG